MGMLDWFKGIMRGDSAAEHLPVVTGEDRGAELAGLNFKTAVDAHMKWKVRLESYIGGTSTEQLKVEVVSRDDQCPLGKWIYDKGGEKFGRILQKTPGKSAVDGDRAHALDGHAHLKDRVEQHGVLVDFLTLHIDETLADRLDETDARDNGLEGAVETETGRGLAIIHARGGDEDALGDGVVRLILERKRGQGERI